MKVVLRQENEQDHKMVFDLIRKAFKKEPLSDKKEQFLVARLRGSSSFIPELSIIAEANGNVVGHILLSEVKIINNIEETTSLALAPVSVFPDYQGKGIGSALIREAHKIAKKLGYNSIVLLGHETYYPKFGYKKAEHFGIEFPFDAPSENCMAIELIPKSLENVHGKVAYPPEFYNS